MAHASAVMLALLMAGESEFSLMSCNGNMVVGEVIVETSFPLPVTAAYAQERLAWHLHESMAQWKVCFDFEKVPLLVEFDGTADGKRWRLRYHEPPKEYVKAMKRKPR